MKKRKLASVTAVLLAACMFLGACSQSGGESSASAGGDASSGAAGTESAASESAEPLAINMMVGFDGVEYPQPGNEIQTMIEEYTNTKLDIQAYPGSTLHEMLPTLIASDELPMVVSYGGSQLKTTYMVNAMKTGVFWDVTDYIQDYPNIASISDLTWETFAINGRNYGIPRERGLARNAVGYRYDWLENLGMEEPETVYDLYEMMLAFAEQDPDGNGQDDTYGTITSPLDYFAIYLGAPNNWQYEDGQMIKNNETEEYMEALDMCRELYARGALHPEYAIQERSQYEALWTEGKAGSYCNINNFAQFVMLDETAVVHAKGVFSSDNGTFTAAGTGHNGVLSFSTTAVPDEETLKGVLNFFDKLGDPEMCNLLGLGIEGKHYNVEDGVAVPVADMQDDFQNNIYMPYSAAMACVYPDTRTMEVQRDELSARTLEILEENEPYAVADPTQGLISETYTEMGADLDTILKDAVTKYIMGEIDKDGYLAEVQNWKDRGGAKVAEEYAAAYEERLGE